MTTTPEPCTHTPGGTCCNRGDLPCPDHFARQLSAFMIGSERGDPAWIGPALTDLDRHSWMMPTVMTLCALIQAYARGPDETVEQAMARVNADITRVPPATRAQAHPWLFRLGVLVRCALAADGDTIADTLQGVKRDPQMTAGPTLAMVSSLARTACAAVAAVDEVQTETVATFACLGSQTFKPAAYPMLVPLALLTDSLRRGQERVDLAVQIAGAPEEQLLAAVGVCGRTLGQLIVPDGAVLYGVNRGSEVTGILDWQDPARDPGRTPEEMMGARAMRVAVAFARGEPDTVVRMFTEVGPFGRQHASETVLGSCSVLSNMIRRYTVASG